MSSSEGLQPAFSEDRSTMRAALEVLASASAAACLSEGYDKPLTFGGLCKVIDYALTHEAVRDE